MDDPEYLRLQERFADDPYVNAITQVIKKLDLQPLREAYRGTGSNPFPPERLLAVALYEIIDKRVSPAQWHKNADTKDQCKLLARGCAPARSTWYTFRDRCESFIESVSEQLVRWAIKDGLVDPAKASLDGSFVRSAATRHRIVNFQQLTKRIETLDRAISLLDDLPQNPPAAPIGDAASVSSQAAIDAIPCWVAATATGRQLQRRQYEKAHETFRKRFAANARRPKRYRQKNSGMILSIWDCDAVIGRDKEHVLCPLYNVQAMVACNSGVILAYDVLAQCTDSGALIPLIKRTQHVTGDRLRQLLADSGYCSLLELQDCEQHGIELFAPVQDTTGSSHCKAADGQRQLPQRAFDFGLCGESCTCPAGHSMHRRARGKKPRADGRTVIEVRWEQSAELCGGCALSGRCLQRGSKSRSVARLEGQEKLDAQAAKMNSEEGKRLQKERATTVERVFGDGKQNRGFRRHHGRSLSRAKAEIGLLVVAQNTVRLYNIRTCRQNAVS